MKPDPTYRPFSRFILRTPLFPFGTRNEMPPQTGNAIFQEALFLASPDLHGTDRSTDPKKRRKFDESLLKYHSRAATRCTPFGLFAGCSVGVLGKETRIELLPPERSGRCTRLDMQYLCALIQELEQKPSIRRQLRFFPNDSLYAIGGKYRYVEYHYKKTLRHHEVVSVEIDDALETLLAAARDGATIDELTLLLAEDDISEEEAANYVGEVVDAQLLKSELDPCVVGGDVLTTLIEKISRLNDVPELEALGKIRDLLHEIDSRPAGTSQHLYREIIASIEKLGVAYEAKFLFQADLFKPVETATISEQLPQRIGRLIDFLTKINVPTEMTGLKTFMQAFQERYEEQEVPLAEVLDNELGIGYPAARQGGNDVSPLINDLVLPERTAHHTEVRLTSADYVLLRKYVECMRDGKTTVVLTDADFKDFGYEHTLADTFQVMVSLTGEGQVYVRSIGGSCGGTLLGRFCHLDGGIRQLVEEVAKTERDMHPEALVAEISHLPESRIGNIASRPVFRDYLFHYLSNHPAEGRELSIGDLLLSVRNGRLLLRSKKYGKEVVPRLTCAHNHSMSPIPVYRFLCDLQHQGHTPGLHCSWNAQLFSGFNYLPRIQFEEFILSRQRWRIKPEEAAQFDRMSDAELQTAMQSLRQKRRIPAKVVIPDSDNELYLDLQRTEYQRLLTGYIARRKGIVLEEFLFDEKTAVVRQAGAPYTNEMIFVFHK